MADVYNEVQLEALKKLMAEKQGQRSDKAAMLDQLLQSQRTPDEEKLKQIKELVDVPASHPYTPLKNPSFLEPESTPEPTTEESTSTEPLSKNDQKFQLLKSLLKDSVSGVRG